MMLEADIDGDGQVNFNVSVEHHKQQYFERSTSMSFTV